MHIGHKKVPFIKLLLLLLCMVCFSHRGAAKQQTPELDSLASQVNELIYKAKPGEAQVIVLDYLGREDLSDLERYRGYLLYAETISASGKPKDAIAALVWARGLAEMLPDSATYISKVNLNKAGVFFDTQDYEMAKIYAEKSIRRPPNLDLMAVGHAPAYLMLGYYDYLQKNYEKARKRYRQARHEYMRHDAKCELPLFYTKMASMLSRQGKVDSAMVYIDSAKVSCEVCDIMTYRLLTEQTVYDIQKENGEFKQALLTSEQIDQLSKGMQRDEQRSRMKVLERNFEMRLKQSEIENLQEINAQKEKVLIQQRRNLMLAVVGLVGLGILVALLIRVNRRRKTVLAALSELNNELEEKVKIRTAHLDDANIKLRKHAQTVEKRNKQLMDFYHIITHNLRAPLGNLAMLVKLHQESIDPHLQKELIENTKQVVSDMNNTVTDLLHTIQYTAASDVEAFPVKFSDALGRVLDEIKRSNSDVDFEVESDFTDAPKIVYPPKFLVSLFHNLLSNTIKYRSLDRPLQVKVTSTNTSEGVVLMVKDNGRGLDLDRCGHKLFQAGQHFHNHPDAKGFGLYMTRLQIENQGGRIWMESEPDQGACVFVAFSPEASV